MSQAKELITSFRFRQDTLANWNLANPILKDGEFILIKDTAEYKVGNGVSKFSELPVRGLPAVQDKGQSILNVMSQKAVTDELNRLDGVNTDQTVEINAVKSEKVDKSSILTTYPSSEPTSDSTIVSAKQQYKKDKEQADKMVQLEQELNGAYIYPTTDFNILITGTSISINTGLLIIYYNNKKYLINNTNIALDAANNIAYLLYNIPNNVLILSDTIQPNTVKCGILNTYGQPFIINTLRYKLNGIDNELPYRPAGFIRKSITNLDQSAIISKVGGVYYNSESIDMSTFKFDGILNIGIVKCSDINYFKNKLGDFKPVYLTFIRGKSATNGTSIVQLCEEVDGVVSMGNNIFAEGNITDRNAVNVQTVMLTNNDKTLTMYITVDWNIIGTESIVLTNKVRIATEYLYYESLSSQYNMSTKNILLLGDSTAEFGFVDRYISDTAGFKVLNAGIGGTTISKRPNQDASSVAYSDLSILAISEAISTNDYTKQIAAVEYLKTSLSDNNERQLNIIKDADYSNIGVIVIMSATNDFVAGVDIPIDAFKKSISDIINNIQTKHPHIKLIYSTPTHRFFGQNESSDSDIVANQYGRKLIDYVTAIKDVCNDNHIPCIDQYNSSGLNKYNHTHYFSDGVHFNDAGCRLIGNRIGRFISLN